MYKIIKIIPLIIIVVIVVIVRGNMLREKCCED